MISASRADPRDGRGVFLEWGLSTARKEPVQICDRRCRSGAAPDCLGATGARVPTAGSIDRRRDARRGGRRACRVRRPRSIVLADLETVGGDRGPGRFCARLDRRSSPPARAALSMRPLPRCAPAPSIILPKPFGAAALIERLEAAIAQWDSRRSQRPHRWRRRPQPRTRARISRASSAAPPP